MQCSTSSFGMLQDYPPTWNEEARQVAFMVGVTAGYYARALAALDRYSRRMFADILTGRLKEITRRGWEERADKYLELTGSTFKLHMMRRWADDETARYQAQYRQDAIDKANGKGSQRTTARRFGGGDE